MVEELIFRAITGDGTDLKYHRVGQGKRWVFLDSHLKEDANVYVAVREINNAENLPSHVDLHRHNCESLFLFIGNKKNLEGLTCEVVLEEEKYLVDSPASVFIPVGITHTYRIVNGGGYFINIILSGKYNDSIVGENQEHKIS